MNQLNHHSAHRVDTDSIPPGIEAHALEFSGSGGEFFRVWIVNVLLSIVTLGFYTPFARRRTAQYFYGHTLVAGSPLEFTAQKRKMVLGFLLLVLFYLLFQLAADTGQGTATTLFLLAGAALAPYLWGSAMRFRLSATRWRGVRLQFAAPWRQVYAASWPVFAIALLWSAVGFALSMMAPELPAPPPLAGPGAARSPGLPTVTPWMGVLVAVALVLTLLCIIRLEFNYKSLLVLRARIGSHAGRWKPVYRDFLKIWLATVAVFVLCVALTLALLAAFVGGSFALLGGLRNMGLFAIVVLVLMAIGTIFIVFLASAPARAYREARMFRLVWSNVGVSQIARFKCRLRTRRYVMLRIKNMFLSLFTLGFYRPFAMVSEYRMKTESVTLHVKGGVDQLAGQLVAEQGSLGDAVADAVGLDLVG
ncbi:MAG TPA: YjgN family protein [Burkholderiaceae bacterium]|nr:YjgN family protein [Burkholderiaceae bacterium]